MKAREAAMEDYRLGRLAARITSGFGWLLCGLGLVLLFWSAFMGATVTAASGFSLSMWSLINIPLALASGGLLALALGLPLILLGQMARAIMDTANYSRALLDLTRRAKPD
ncbi:MAG TPA: hypothetical protein PKE19_11395 [Aestuariivirga sp.]|nr:hypothetical protein [Aestuariivirga sp.]